MKTEVISVLNRWPTQDYYCHKEFLASLGQFGVAPTLLGMDEDWGGLMSKPRKLYQYLKEGRNKGEIIIVVDAWDLVFAKHPEAIASEWQDAFGMWTAGAERACFPDGSLAEKHPESVSSYRYLNSGFIISTPAEMLAVLEAMNLPNIPNDHVNAAGEAIHPNDQHEYMVQYVNQPIPMRVDTETKLVWNLCGVDGSNFDFGHKIPVNRETGQAPGCFHFNGPAKTDGMMDQILKHLELR